PAYPFIIYFIIKNINYLKIKSPLVYLFIFLQINSFLDSYYVIRYEQEFIRNTYRLSKYLNDKTFQDSNIFIINGGEMNSFLSLSLAKQNKNKSIHFFNLDYVKNPINIAIENNNKLHRILNIGNKIKPKHSDYIITKETNKKFTYNIITKKAIKTIGKPINKIDFIYNIKRAFVFLGLIDKKYLVYEQPIYIIYKIQ
ncbi:hypothetical protein, partial [Flavobacterium sp.]|uniref:hypothetical protein n=1 Tax=Flavobacterium sp. TaxID=239 RepID=UPI003528635C